MDAHTKVGSTWKKLNGIHVKVASTWKEVLAAYVKVGSTWKQFYGSLVTLSGTSGSPNLANRTESNPTAATTQWRFDTSGRVYRTVDGVDTQFQDGIEWHQDQDAPSGDYWIQATLHAGDSTTSGDALTTWHRLLGSGAATRSFLWTATPPAGSKDGTLLVKISSDASGSPVLASGYYRATADVV